MFWGFVAASALVIAATGVGISGPALWRQVACFYVLLAALTVSTLLTRRLPLQNVVACGLAVLATSTMLVAVSVRTGFPFGRLEFTDELGPRWLGLVHWAAPFLWLATVLSARETARVVLRPWRRTRSYGWSLLGTAAGLAMIHVIAIEPFVRRTFGWWKWGGDPATLHWFGAPLGALGGALALIVIFLLVAVPWLVVKRPSAPSPPDLRPVFVWLLLGLWYAVGNARAGLWVPAVFEVLALVGVAILAWRGKEAGVSPASAPVAASVSAA